MSDELIDKLADFLSKNLDSFEGSWKGKAVFEERWEIIAKDIVEFLKQIRVEA